MSFAKGLFAREARGLPSHIQKFESRHLALQLFDARMVFRRRVASCAKAAASVAAFSAPICADTAVAPPWKSREKSCGAVAAAIRPFASSRTLSLCQTSSFSAESPAGEKVRVFAFSVTFGPQLTAIFGQWFG